MRIFIVILVCITALCFVSPGQGTRNLAWFEAKGAIENYRSSDGSKVRPKIVLFSHDWDLVSVALRTEVIAKLKTQPTNNPVLLDADCTDESASAYIKLLESHDLGRSLPVIGIHDDKGWQFIDCNAELASDSHGFTKDGTKRLAELVTDKARKSGS